MRRAAILLVSLGAMLVLVAGVAVAANVDCGDSSQVRCDGTNNADHIEGTNDRDIIYAFDNPRGTYDVVDANGGPDEVHGDGGKDDINGGTGADDLFGGRADDIINSVDGVEGNDYIDCGRGNNDRARADFGDIVVRCTTVTRV